MAVACITTTPSLMFSYEFQFLEFSADCHAVRIAICDEDDTVFSGEYIPDKAGEVKLYDLNEIVDSYIGTAPSAVLKLVCTDLQSNQSVSYSTTVLRSSVSYNCTAEEFVKTHFLTSSSSIRYTAMGRYECLSFYALTSQIVNVDISVEKDGALYLVQKTLVEACSVGMNMVNVSPSSFIVNGTIIDYTVKCGSRSQRYVVVPEIDADPAIAYRNRFNVWDTYYFTGTKESDPQFDRAQAWINGQYLTYSVKEVLQFKAMTGIVPLGGEEYLHDIARSPEIRLLDAQGAMRDLLTVMECDIKAVNDDDALNRYTITYRHADKVSAKSFAPVATRIFDDSFDNSYE